MTTVLIVITGTAVAGLLWAGSQASPWRRVAKVAASTGFVAVALSVGAAGAGYGRFVLAALALSWLGDLCLTYPSPRAFRAGLVAFLLAHGAYIAAFSVRGIDQVAAMVASAAVMLVALGAWRWLRPHLGASMRRPVFAYIILISLMVTAAFGTVAADPDWRIAVGAVAFFVSDLLVARDRFVVPGFVNRTIGLPLYYLGQTLLALSAGT